MTITDVGLHAQRRPFPTGQLRGCESALILFGAAFLGGNDGWHIANAGLTATVVDTDRKKLEAMRELYPTDWEFVCADAFEYASHHAPETFDVVTADCFTNLSARCLEAAELFTTIARRLVVVTATDEALADVDPTPPTGWTQTLVNRTRSVHWLVLERQP